MTHTIEKKLSEVQSDEMIKAARDLGELLPKRRFFGGRWLHEALTFYTATDSTSIWLFQLDGQRINLLEYFENSGEALPYYISWLNAKGYNFAGHYVPHDASQHELGSGLTRTEIARDLGVNFTQVRILRFPKV